MRPCEHVAKCAGCDPVASEDTCTGVTVMQRNRHRTTCGRAFEVACMRNAADLTRRGPERGPGARRPGHAPVSTPCRCCECGANGHCNFATGDGSKVPCPQGHNRAPWHRACRAQRGIVVRTRRNQHLWLTQRWQQYGWCVNVALSRTTSPTTLLFRAPPLGWPPLMSHACFLAQGAC